MSELTPEQLASRASRIVGFTSEAAKQTNISKGYISADKANKLPIDSTGGRNLDNQLSPQEREAFTKETSRMIPPQPGTSPIDTTQPNPTTVNATPFTQPAQNQPNQPIQNAHQQVTAAGIPPPQTGGEAAGTVQGAIAQNTPQAPSITPLSPIDQQMAADPGYQQLLADRKEYADVANQGSSLLDMYNQMVKKAGIPAINKELLNTKKIIDGTEDDIRSEVQAASGFATDSQVLALASARNKQLIKNYNNLLDTKAMAMESVNTMVNLAAQDRQFAMQSITQKMQIDEQLMSYRDKFVQNAQEGYKNVINAIGYDGLFQSLQADPSSIGVVEKTMGFAPGTLQLAAQQATEQRKQQAEMQALDIKGKQAQIANIYSEMGSRSLNDQLKRAQFEIDNAPGIVDEKTLGKIQASPEFKTINGLLPAVQTIRAYQDAVKKYGTYAVAGEGRGVLSATYGNALAAWKTLAQLGALSGADFGLAENAIPKPGLFQFNSTALAKLNTSLETAVTQTQNLTNRLTQFYPTADTLLNRQQDDILVSAYPDKYKVGPDGQVYEITK